MSTVAHLRERYLSAVCDLVGLTVPDPALNDVATKAQVSVGGVEVRAMIDPRPLSPAERIVAANELLLAERALATAAEDLLGKTIGAEDDAVAAAARAVARIMRQSRST
jgi:hypothetical protein